jgi:hypothetical protein
VRERERAFAGADSKRSSEDGAPENAAPAVHDTMAALI